MKPGSTVAHYRIISALGSGGMGDVYLAEDTKLERRVALKALRPDPTGEASRRFLQEAKAASRLSHPNIAYLHELGEAEVESRNIQFLAMEFVDGETLDRKMREHPVDTVTLIRIAVQVAGALEAAHAEGITHRDIKPANIMVTARGHVKVLDFGLAKFAPPADLATANTQFMTTPGMLLGTIPYMSPEQALGREVDERSDIFSLGAVMYEMAAGRLPFSGATTVETISLIINARPDPLSRLSRATPLELERVIEKCLEKDRERRYQSARDLLVDLKNLQREKCGAPHVGTGRMRALIVDDEELARGVLAEMLRSHPEIEIVGQCSNGFEAVKKAGELKPDLMFLDIQMPKLDGFEVLQLIDPSVNVIFATAYDQYALRAFDAHAVDYLLKPFSEERLHSAVEKVRRAAVNAPLNKEESGTARPAPFAVDLAQAARPPEQFAQRLVVKDGTKVHVIPVEKLDYAESQDDYVSLRSERKNYLKQQTIASLEESLDPARFIRIHRSYIVNLDRVTQIEPYTKDSKIAILSDGSRLPVSRAGYTRLKTLLGE